MSEILYYSLDNTHCVRCNLHWASVAHSKVQSSSLDKKLIRVEHVPQQDRKGHLSHIKFVDFVSFILKTFHFKRSFMHYLIRFS